MNPPLPNLLLLCAIAVSAAAAVGDLRTGLIPNRLTLPPLLIAPLAHYLLGGPAALGGCLLGSALCSLMPFALWRRGALGGGDLKLFAALGAITGPSCGLEVQALGCGLAAVQGLVLLLRRRKLVATLYHGARALMGALPFVAQPAVARCFDTRLRMGPSILAATLVCAGGRVMGWLP